VPILSWVAHHRFWMLGLGVMVLILAIVGGVWFFLLRTPATRVDLRQALRLYRKAEHAEIVGKSVHVPPPGVYRYRTTGGEELNIAGISRSFPPTTNMIVTDAKCATVEWEPLEQHTEGLVVCPQSDGALSITSALSFEQIAGTQTTSVIHCPAHTYFVPPKPAAGERWSRSCHSKGETTVFSGRVIGPSSITVGGQKAPALHTRLTLFFSGSQSGANPNDYWISQNGLILRQEETVDVSEKAGPLGSVRYTEKMAITLLSMAPIR
jgi:hypothetical protein